MFLNSPLYLKSIQTDKLDHNVEMKKFEVVRQKEIVAWSWAMLHALHAWLV